MYRISVLAAIHLLFCADLAAQTAKYRAKTFTDVTCKLYINYQSGLSSGKYFYTEYKIIPNEKQFVVEETLRGSPRMETDIPYAKEVQKETDTLENMFYLNALDPDRYYSVIKNYTVNEKTCEVYRHINYNCYDLM